MKDDLFPNEPMKVKSEGGEVYINRAPYQKHSATSKAAAMSMLKPLGRLQQMVYDEILERGGCTDLDLEVTLGLIGSTARPRRVELLRRGLIEDSGERRPTDSGRLAVVWRATKI